MAAISFVSAARDLRPIDAPLNKENTRLIWLDADINDSYESVHTQNLFRELNPAVQFYTDLTKCVTFIKSSQDEHILLIVSGAFARQLLSQVHNLRLLTAVFILCENNVSYSELLAEYSKIVNIFSDRNSLLMSIEETLIDVEKQLLAFSFFDQKQTSTRDLSKDSASFLWHQLLIDALKKMPRDEKAKEDIVELCSSFYAMNNREKEEIRKFKESYHCEKAIKWYTKECFLYKLLNRAIRTEDIELLYLFRSFISDLCEQLENESKKLKAGDVLTLYRGQQLPIEEFKKLRESSGILISTNGFLSTSRNINKAIEFARQSSQKSDMQTLIFEIHADPSLKSVVFADIKRYSAVQIEQEVLFGLNATFKVGLTGMDDDIQMMKVSLTATDEGTTHIKEYMQAQEYEMKDYSPMVYFGRILWRDLGRADRAMKYFDMLVKTLPENHPDMSDVYNEIAPLWSEIGDLNLALEYYEKAYKIRRQTLQPNHPKISISLNNIGLTYAENGEHLKALKYYWRSLAITKENTPEPNQDWALRLGNIGWTYIARCEHDKALTFLNEAYDIYKRVRPDQHRDIAWCLGSIGVVYEKQGDIDCALKYYHQQLEMQEKCLSSENRLTSASLNRIAHIYANNGQLKKALAFCEEKLNTQKIDMGENHPRVASTLMTIGDLRKEQREYYEQALCILQKCKPKDELRTIECLEKLGELDFNDDKFEEGLTRWMHILDIRRRIHSPDNPKIASTLKRIGEIYLEHMNDYSEALHYYSASSTIYHAKYGPEHKEVAEVNNKIYRIQIMLDSDGHDHRNVATNKKNHVSLIDEPKIKETSNICVLL